MAKKPNQSLFQKLTKLFKSGPVVRRKIRNLDTAVAVPDKTKSSGALLFQKSMAPTYATITANAYNLSERLMRYQDFQEMEYCLHGDTKIAIPGGYKAISELAAECDGRPDHTFIVYAYDHNLQRIVPALGKQARQTRVDESYKVTFDNGQHIIGTPNHRLMKRDGTFCKIEDLQPGDAMMPFYRRDLFSGCKEEGDGYRWIYTMDRRSNMNGWVAEHRVIGEMLKGSPLVEGEVVHHRNFVKHDNRPENLEVMTDEAHRKLHAEIINGAKWSEQNSDWIQKFKANHSKFMTDNNPAERQDITFGRILELAERTDFNSRRMCEALDTDPNVIKRRLRKHGYKDFETFARAYNPDWRNAGWNNKGENNPRYVKAVTFDKICSHFSKGMSNQQLADSLGTTIHVIEGRIRERGYKNYSEFSSTYDNLKVVSIEPHGVIPLYDLTVDGYKNFATDTVISHNTPEIAAAMDIYADETVAQDDKGRSLHIYSDNERIKEILEDLFYDTLNVEFNLRSWARNLVKYGDFFLYNDVSPEHGVINAFPIPVNEIEREENYDPNDPMAVRYRWVTLGNRTLENWEVTHFRLLGNDMFLPYGSSVIEPARRIWRQLILIEDAMLVYRVVRAPERRVFYIDVANIPPENVPMYVEEQRKNLRSSQVIDRNTGRVDLRYNPLCNSLKTLIKLQDGRTVPLSKVIEEWESGNRNMWAYSVDLENKRLAPGKIVWAGVTRRDAELVRVHLDDGTWYDCTPDHRWMLRNGEYVEASSLKEGDSLMALYAKKTTVDDGHKITGYEKIYDPFSQQYVLTHRNSVLVEQGADAIKGKIIHHVDFDKKNNNPDNLRPMTWGEHHALHGSLAAERNRSPSGREASRRRMTKTWAEKKINRNTFVDMWKDESIRDKRVKKLSLQYDGEFIGHCLRVLSSIGKNLSTKETEFINALNADTQFSQYIASKNKGFKNGYLKMTRGGLQTRLKSLGCAKGFESLKRLHLMSSFNLDEVKSFCESVPGCSRKNVLERYKMSRNDLVELVRLSGESYEEFSDQYLPGAARYKNHKVARVERLEHREDTGCITVEKYHNFAAGPSTDCITDQDYNKVNSFIYLHNSVDEDYFIPVRGGESGTKIDTLAGGQNAAAVEDVAYIQKKLFAALKIPRAYLGYDEALSCVVPETPVDLLDGRTLTVAQIKEELDAGRDVWVYSVDKDTHEMKPGKVVWAGPTRKNAELVRVTLDNGESFTCTPDHKWMLRNGEWCEAGNLTPETSLMPVHRRRVAYNGGRDYEQVFDPAAGKWVWTHKLVAAATPVEIHESAAVEDKTVIHHRNINRFDNNPSNLVVMGFNAHRQLHVDMLAETRRAALIKGKYSGLNNGWAKKCRDRVEHLWSTQRLIGWCLENKPTSKKKIVSGYGLSETQLDRLISENGMTYQQFADRYVFGGYKIARHGRVGYENPNYSRASKGLGSLGGKYEVVECPLCGSQFQRNAKTRKKFCSHGCYTTFGSGKKAPDPKFIREGLLNHTVASVEFLTERRDTWCIEVAGTHTFGLSKGVIISNSKATLAQEDIRFSRTINVIQKTLISELNKLAIIHLYAHGFDSEDLQNFTLRLSNPSTVAQQQKLELWRSKFEIAGSAPEGQMSKEFIRKEIWGLNDEQIRAIDEQRLREKLIDGAIENAKPEEEGGGEEEGGEDLFGGEEEGEEEAGGGEEEGGEEGAGEDLFAGDDESEKEPQLNLLTSSDDPSDDEEIPVKFSLKNFEVPVKAQKQLKRALYNRSRIKHSGPDKLFSPDLKSMTDYDSSSDTDPFDSKWMSSYAKNPLGESSRIVYKTPVGIDVLNALQKMASSKKFQSAASSQRSQILNEDAASPGRADDKELDVLYIIDEDYSGSEG